MEYVVIWLECLRGKNTKTAVNERNTAVTKLHNLTVATCCTCAHYLERSTSHVIPWLQTEPDDCRRLSSAPLPGTWAFVRILCAPLAGRTRTSGDSGRTGRTRRRRAPTHTSLPVRRSPVQNMVVLRYNTGW